MTAILTMGIDPSLTSTGVSVGGATSSIRPVLNGVPRLIEIRNAIVNLVSEHDIQVVAIEGYSYGSRNSHAHSLGELGGVVRVALYERGIPFVDIPPTVRAKFATGKGNAGKSEVVSAVSAKTGLVWSGGDGADRCDAWIMEQILLTKFGNSPYDWGAGQMDALAKVEWGGVVGV